MVAERVPSQVFFHSFPFVFLSLIIAAEKACLVTQAGHEVGSPKVLIRAWPFV